MTLTREIGEGAEPWRASAAYLYTLDLDGPALAWEYLRRRADYREHWARTGSRQRDRGAARWGLRFRRGSPARCPASPAALGRQD